MHRLHNARREEKTSAPSTSLRRLVLFVAIAGSPLRAWCDDEEIAPLRLTGIEGHLSVQYTRDNFDTGREDEPSSSTSQTSLQEGLFVQAKGYVYHPNLMNFTVGGGPLLVRQKLETDAGAASARETLVDFFGRLSFLDEKPFPFTLYYDRSSPTVSVGLTDSFLQTNTKTGATLSVLQPVLPWSVNGEVFRLRSEGTGRQIVMDDITDQGAIRMYGTLGDGGYGQFSYQASRRESRTGNPALAIEPTTTDARNATFDTRHVFGDGRAGYLTNAIAYNTQDYVVAGNPYLSYQDMRFSPYLRWQHAPDLFSFYQYSLYKSESSIVGAPDDQQTTNQSAAVGINRQWEESVTAAGDIHGQHNRSSGVTQRTDGVSGQLSFRRPVPIGVLSLSASLRYDRYERETDVRQAGVTIEPIVLTGTDLVPLVHEYVVEPPAIVVRSATLVQTYVRDVDYFIQTIGSKTYVQRAASGAINPGDTVRVDYDFLSGGDATYTTLDRGVFGNLTLFRYFNVFSQYRDREQRLGTGSPTTPLNSTRNFQSGARADVPLWETWWVGGEARFERQQEDVAPFRSTNYQAYTRFPLPLTSTAMLHLSWRRVIVENETSPVDVQLTGWTGRFQARPWYRITLTAEASQDEDTGGPEQRLTRSYAVLAEWRIRQFSVRGEGRKTREEQGSFGHERSSLRLVAQREF
jgi:hypothetical protein